MEAKRFIEILNDNGIKAVETKANKYGQEEIAYRLEMGNAKAMPLVYKRIVDKLEECDMDKFMDQIRNTEMNIDVNDITSKEYMLNHVVFAIRRLTEDESICKMPVRGDLELYFRVLLNDATLGEASYKVTEEQLKLNGVSKKELYSAARKNTKENTVIMSMIDMLRELGAYISEEEMSEIPMYVVTNKSRCHGAGAMECEELLDDFCNKHEFKGVVIIPSSIHEFLLVPIANGMSEEDINAMIRDINVTQLASEEVLSDHVYYHYVA